MIFLCEVIIMITISLILFIPILATGVAFFICSKFIRKTCREIAFLRADPVLALVSQMWSGRMAHPIALDRLQGARAALKLAEASGDPEGIAYAEWALNAAHQGFGFVAALSAARVSFAGEG